MVTLAKLFLAYGEVIAIALIATSFGVLWAVAAFTAVLAVLLIGAVAVDG